MFVEYIEDFLKKVVYYVQIIQVNMGGIEIVNVFFEVFQCCCCNVFMQIFLFIDGMVWDVEQFIKFIIEVVDDGVRNNLFVRVFIFGVGNVVLYYLIEFVVRVGGGYVQLVLENECMEKKVFNMLKVGLILFVINVSV